MEDSAMIFAFGFVLGLIFGLFILGSIKRTIIGALKESNVIDEADWWKHGPKEEEDEEEV